MKKAFFQMTLVYLSILLGLTISSQIAKKLWGIDYIGEINDVRFTDNSNALISTKNGILALLSLSKNEIVLKKNNIYGIQWKVKTTEKFSVLFDEITGSLDIVENKILKIKNTINLTTPNVSRNSKIAIKDLKEKDSFIGVFIDGPVLKVFNEDKIIRSFESKTSDVFIDLFINTDKFEVKILSFNSEEKKIKVSTLDLKVKSNKIDSFFEYKFENNPSLKELKTLLSDETFLIYDNSTNSFVFGKLNKEKTSFDVNTGKLSDLNGLLNCEINDVEKTKFVFVCESQSKYKSAFLLNPLNNSESKLKTLDFETKDTIRNIIFDNKNAKNPFLFVVRKTQANDEFSVEAFKFEMESSSFKSLGSKSYNLANGDEIKMIRGNFSSEGKERFSYVIVTNHHQIRTVHINENVSEMYIVLNQKFLNIVKSEIIHVKNLEKKKRSKPTLNTLSSLIHQKDITKVVKNAYNLFVSDIQDVYFNIKNSIESLINPSNKKTEEIIANKNEKHFLILFSDNSELFILDAITGEKKFEKKFHNFNLFNIRTQSNPNLLKAESQQSFKEIENPLVTFELKNKESKSDSDLLLIQINLQDFSYQEIDFNLKNYFSLEALATKINKVLSQKDFKEVIEFQLPLSSSTNLEANSKQKKELNGKIVLTYNEEQNTLFGMKVSTSESTKEFDNLKPIWNFKLNNHKLLQYKLANVPENIHTVYNSSGKILYKHIDHNVILVISNIEKTQNISVTLISVVNGKVLFQTQIASVDLEQKINAIFDENFVIINYVKKSKNLLRNEVFTIEIMKREIEHSLMSLFQKIFNLKTLFSAFNPLDDEEEFNSETGRINNSNVSDKDEELVHSDDLVFLTKTFFLPRRVKNMFLNKTKLNVANKYIIFLLESNQVFLVDKRILSPRRPYAKVDPRAPNSPPVVDPLMNSPYADLETSPYFPNIVLDPKFIVDVDYFYSQINNISIQPTKFESTFILCTTGLSLNCYKVYPDKTFDYFVSIFPNVFILIALLVLFVFTFTFRRYVKKLELKQLFLNS